METFTAFIIIVLFGHFIADFIVQTREQAENKSKNLEALSRHILSYVTDPRLKSWACKAVHFENEQTDIRLVE